MWKHLDEVLSALHALIIANPPTYLAGFEKYYGVRNGINVYLTSNRPDEAAFLAKGKKISEPNEQELFPLDYEITAF